MTRSARSARRRCQQRRRLLRLRGMDDHKAQGGGKPLDFGAPVREQGGGHHQQIWDCGVRSAECGLIPLLHSAPPRSPAVFTFASRARRAPAASCPGPCRPPGSRPVPAAPGTTASSRPPPGKGAVAPAIRESPPRAPRRDGSRNSASTPSSHSPA